MNRSNTLLMAAGVLVLALTNAVVLMGVASNRRQPPDSVLTLTEQELGPQWSWMWWQGENSGLSLRLKYRFESIHNSRLDDSGEYDRSGSYGSFGPPAWLDRNKLAAPGFDVTTPTTNEDTHYDRMLGRDVFLVLELDGPARARAFQGARDFLSHQEREIAANPERQGNAQRLQSAQQALQREEHEVSRLFIVDAGLDQSALRRRYADRAHYAIVQGNVRPFVMRDATSAKVYGTVTAVRCDSINVPLQFRSTVPLDSPTNVVALARAEKGHPFAIQVAFGSHLEPWVVSAHAGPT